MKVYEMESILDLNSLPLVAIKQENGSEIARDNLK